MPRSRRLKRVESTKSLPAFALNGRPFALTLPAFALNGRDFEVVLGRYAAIMP